MSKLLGALIALIGFSAPAFAQPVVGNLRAENALKELSGHSTAALARSNISIGPGRISVFDYIQPGDADDTAAFNRAVQVAATTNLPLYIPSSRPLQMSCANGFVSIPRSANGLTIYGDGMGQSVIDWDSTAGSDTCGLFTLAAPGSAGYTLNYLTMRDFSIKGNFIEGAGAVPPFTANHRIPIQLYQSQAVRITGVELNDLPYFGFVVRSSESFWADHNYVHDVARDGISMGDVTSSYVTNNRIDHDDDDGISWFASDNAESVTGAVLRNLVLTGNTLTDTQGFDLIGMQNAQISGNIMDRVRWHGMYTVPDTVAMFGQTNISITGNIITNMIDRTTVDNLNQGSTCIFLSGLVSNGPSSATPTAVAPLLNDPTAGALVPSYPYNFLSGGASNLAPPTPGMVGVTVANNQCSRTLNTGVLYSTYGYGQMFTRHGFLNPTMTDPILSRGTGVVLAGNFYDTDISDNIFRSKQTGISISPVSGFPLNDPIKIHDNQFIDFHLAGISFPNGIANQAIDVVGNTFDGDPLRTHPNRSVVNADSWVQTHVTGELFSPVAIFTNGSAIKLTFNNNRLTNLMGPLDSTGYSEGSWDAANNIVMAAPTGILWNALNEGVGYIFPAYKTWQYAIIDGTVTSSTFGRIVSFPVSVSTTFPSTGTYVQGAFVRNVGVNSANFGGVVSGWYRATTGSTNAIGTDWLPVGTLPGTINTNTIQGTGSVSSVTPSGGAYLSSNTPLFTIDAPDQSGGTQATAVVNQYGQSNWDVSTGGGTGCSVNDILTLQGGTFTVQGSVKVSTVTGGVVTAVIGNNSGVYTVLPADPATFTGGTCTTSPTINVRWFPRNTTVTAPGSGYSFPPSVAVTGSPFGNTSAVASIVGTIAIGAPATVTGSVVLQGAGSTGAGTPTTANIATGFCSDWTNTTSKLTERYCNVAGTLLPVLFSSVTPAVTTAGTTLATATVLVSESNDVTTCSSGGVALPTTTPIGDKIKIFNRCGATFNIYPDTSGDTIEGGTAGAAVTLASTLAATFTHITTTNWLQN